MPEHEDMTLKDQKTKGNNIVLIGMPGVGKSTIGIVIAKMTNRMFVDTDLLIQNDYGAVLYKIIEKLGDEGFIEYEESVLLGIESDNAIISTGGSAVYSNAAMKHMKDIGTVVYLSVTFEELEERLGDLSERGVVVKDSEDRSLKSLYQERTALYEKYADITIDTTGLSLRRSAETIAKAIV